MKLVDLVEALDAIDVNFVADLLFAHIDEITTSSNSPVSCIRILNEIFQSYDMTFTYIASSPELVIRGGYHKSGKIVIYVGSELRQIKYADVFNEFSNQLTAIVRHELTHREQAVRSKGMAFNMPTHSTYLRNRHELGAFAQEIHQQLINLGLSNTEILKALRDNQHDILDQSIRFRELTSRYSKQKLQQLYKQLYFLLNDKQQTL